MKIGVLSDTHIPERADTLSSELLDTFRGVDLILHAGDITSIEVIETLKKIAPVKVVHGNIDPLEIQNIFPEKEIIRVGKFTIGLTHGWGRPKDLITTVQKMFDQKLDVIVFGHSHIPYNETKNGILFFNPGSPTDTLFSPYQSCGMLEITDTIKATIIKLSP